MSRSGSCAPGRWVALLALTGGLVAGCGSETSEQSTASTSSTSAASTSTTTGSVVVTRDVVYATAPEGDWNPPLLDVYAPPGAHDLPMVVFFHGSPDTVNKTSLDYPELADAIARLGAVVFVANWGAKTSPPTMSAAGATTAELLDGMRQGGDEGACAVSFAVTHAAEYGADPNRLVLSGHSGGAGFAFQVAMTGPSSFSGCAVPAATWTPDGLMLWEGDFGLIAPVWDAFTTDLPDVLAVLIPWQKLNTSPSMAVELAVSTWIRANYRRSAASTTEEWLAWRDPTGKMQSDLDALGAFSDGFVDVGEWTELMANAMNAHGLRASLLPLADPDTTHMSLAPTDLALIAQHTLSLAGE